MNCADCNKDLGCVDVWDAEEFCNHCLAGLCRECALQNLNDPRSCGGIYCKECLDDPKWGKVKA